MTWAVYMREGARWIDMGNTHEPTWYLARLAASVRLRVDPDDLRVVAT
jgi:hypothetical protein